MTDIFMKDLCSFIYFTTYVENICKNFKAHFYINISHVFLFQPAAVVTSATARNAAAATASAAMTASVSDAPAARAVAKGAPAARGPRVEKVCY